MRILLLTQKQPLPLADGYNLRIYHYVKRLAARHELHLVSLDEGAMPEDLRDCFASVHVLPLREPPRVSSPFTRLRRAFSSEGVYDYDPEVLEGVEKVLRTADFDVVWVSGWRMLLYTQRLDGVPVFGDVIDEGVREARLRLLQSRTPVQLVYRLKDWAAARGFERKYFQHLDLCNFVAEEDAECTRGICPGLPLSVVHNGVDADFFSPRDVPEDYPSLIFEGGMSHVPNAEGIVHFHRNAFPMVKAAVPETRLWIVGRDPTPEVRALAGPDVEVTGFVDDVRPYLVKASLFISPLIGGAGIKNKILQAWSMGLPVVSTPISAGGLAASPGKNIEVAEGPRNFAEACVRLLRDDEKRETMGAEGRRTVLERYSWDTKARELEALIERVAARHTPA